VTVIRSIKDGPDQNRAAHFAGGHPKPSNLRRGNMTPPHEGAERSDCVGIRLPGFLAIFCKMVFEERSQESEKVRITAYLLVI
jgi:hypothetical protein